MFDKDAVLPVVTEIVGVEELGHAAIDQCAEAYALGLIDLAAPHRVLWIGFAIDPVADPEVIEVMVLPRHHRLDDFVQGAEVGGQADLELTPDAGLEMQQFDAKAGNPVGHGRPGRDGSLAG